MSFWPLVFLANKIKQISNARRWSSGKSRYAQSELSMGEDDHRTELPFVDTEKDLGVTFSRNLKFSNHIKIQVNKATGILGRLKRSLRYWTLDTCRTLQCVYVRTQLEYATVFWSPPSKKDTRLSEPSVHCSSLSQSGPARGIRGHARRLSGQSSIELDIL